MAESGERSSGTVKWFNGWKGFGFITPDDRNSEDIFVHQTSINSDGYRTLYDGQRVDFDVEVGDDGRSRAVNVVGLKSSGNRGGRGGGGGVECYNCGMLGHFARDCYSDGGDESNGGRGRGGGGYVRGRGGYRGGPMSDGDGGGRRGGRGYNVRGRGGYRRRGGPLIGGDGEGEEGYGRGRGRGRGGGGGGRGGRGGCYNCGEEGHFARDCSDNPQN